jgi:hypothetical protein
MSLATTLAVHALERPKQTVPGFEAISMMTWVLPIVITVIVLGSVLAFLVPLLRRSAENSRLLQTGEPAQARILGLQDTGVKINDNPQLRLVVEVHPMSRPPFQAEVIAVVSFLAIPRIQPGCMVQVKFDPMNPAKVALEGI